MARAQDSLKRRTSIPAVAFYLLYLLQVAVYCITGTMRKPYTDDSSTSSDGALQKQSRTRDFRKRRAPPRVSAPSRKRTSTKPPSSMEYLSAVSRPTAPPTSYQDKIRKRAVSPDTPGTSLAANAPSRDLQKVALTLTDDDASDVAPDFIRSEPREKTRSPRKRNRKRFRRRSGIQDGPPPEATPPVLQGKTGRRLTFRRSGSQESVSWTGRNSPVELTVIRRTKEMGFVPVNDGKLRRKSCPENKPQTSSFAQTDQARWEHDKSQRRWSMGREIAKGAKKDSMLPKPGEDHAFISLLASKRSSMFLPTSLSGVKDSQSANLQSHTGSDLDVPVELYRHWEKVFRRKVLRLPPETRRDDLLGPGVKPGASEKRRQSSIADPLKAKQADEDTTELLFPKGFAALQEPVLQKTATKGTAKNVPGAYLTEKDSKLPGADRKLRRISGTNNLRWTSAADDSPRNLVDSTQHEQVTPEPAQPQRSSKRKDTRLQRIQPGTAKVEPGYSRRKSTYSKQQESTGAPRVAAGQENVNDQGSARINVPPPSSYSPRSLHTKMTRSKGYSDSCSRSIESRKKREEASGQQEKGFYMGYLHAGKVLPPISDVTAGPVPGTTIKTVPAPHPEVLTADKKREIRRVSIPKPLGDDKPLPKGKQSKPTSRRPSMKEKPVAPVEITKGVVSRGVVKPEPAEGGGGRLAKGRKPPKDEPDTAMMEHFPSDISTKIETPVVEKEAQEIVPMDTEKSLVEREVKEKAPQPKSAAAEREEGSVAEVTHPESPPAEREEGSVVEVTHPISPAAERVEGSVLEVTHPQTPVVELGERPMARKETKADEKIEEKDERQAKSLLRKESAPPGVNADELSTYRDIKREVETHELEKPYLKPMVDISTLMKKEAGEEVNVPGKKPDDISTRALELENVRADLGRELLEKKGMSLAEAMQLEAERELAEERLRAMKKEDAEEMSKPGRVCTELVPLEESTVTCRDDSKDATQKEVEDGKKQSRKEAEDAKESKKEGKDASKLVAVEGEKTKTKESESSTTGTGSSTSGSTSGSTTGITTGTTTKVPEGKDEQEAVEKPAKEGDKMLPKDVGEEPAKEAAKTVSKHAGEELAKKELLPTKEDESAKKQVETAKKDVVETAKKDVAETAKKDVAETAKKDVAETAKKDVAETAKKGEVEASKKAEEEAASKKAEEEETAKKAEEEETAKKAEEEEASKKAEEEEASKKAEEEMTPKASTAIVTREISGVEAKDGMHAGEVVESKEGSRAVSPRGELGAIEASPQVEPKADVPTAAGGDNALALQREKPAKPDVKIAFIKPVGNEAFYIATTHKRTIPVLLLLGNILVLIIILVLSHFGVFYWFYFGPIAPIPPVRQHKEKHELVCRNIRCGVAGSTLYYALNNTIQPCDSMFQFVCGQWVHKPTEAYQKIILGAEKRFVENMYSHMRQIVERFAAASLANSAIGKMARLYRGCLDQDYRDSRGAIELKELMRDYRLRDWPFQGGFNGNPATHVADFIRDTGIGVFVSVRLVPDPDDPNELRERLVALECSSFVIPIDTLLTYRNEQKEMVKAYKNYMSHVIDEYTGSVRDTIVANIFAFEVNLAFRCNAQCRKKRLKKVQVKDLVQSDGDSIDWLKFLKAIFGPIKYSITEDTQLLVRSTTYLKKLASVLRGDATKSSRAMNYLGWRFMHQFSRHASTAHRAEHKTFYENILAQAELPEWKRCLFDVTDVMPFVVGHIYVEQVRWRATDFQVHRMVTTLRETLDHLVWKLKWMTSTTREKFKAIISRSAINVGYPPWMMNSSALDAYHSSIPASAGYVKCYASALKNKFQNHLKILVGRTEAVNKLSYFIFPTRLVELHQRTGPPRENLFYDIRDNAFIVPSGVMTPPFYSAEATAALNFGGLGMLVARDLVNEFFHAMDGHWMTDTERQQYKTKSECIIKAIAKFNDKPVSENILHCAGLMADFLALRIAYSAYHSFLDFKDEGTLPGLETMNPDQVFFIAAVRTLCTRIRETHYVQVVRLKMSVTELEHMDGILKIMDEWMDAFYCRPLVNESQPVFKECLTPDEPAPSAKARKRSLWHPPKGGTIFGAQTTKRSRFRKRAKIRSTQRELARPDFTLNRDN
ncbi:uncharacterized protein LOC135389066 [Ornithodoros turicata]|uniref:uncharacterized protein LOC135389066 n=1 Tax=Ornithodoros turicata TaxID=34597 RepID=UPI003139D7C6